jgi:tRNA A37 threonylcarbamoyladenosine biosynthesis protein TsaE
MTPESVCVIEWADRIEEMLKEIKMKVIIEKDLEKGPDFRKIRVVTEER